MKSGLQGRMEAPVWGGVSKGEDHGRRLSPILLSLVLKESLLSAFGMGKVILFGSHTLHTVFSCLLE